MQSPIPEVSVRELTDIFDGKYRATGPLGPVPARRLRWGYFSPEDHYEALVRRLVTPHTAWLDVGCGRAIFPSNDALSKELSQRCRLLVGVDPDATIQENPYVHRRVQGLVGDLGAEERFDLVTMRMVAEHVVEPRPLLAKLAELVVPGGLALVYTINRWSPVPLITAATPFALHHPVKRLLWQTEAKDTFPTAYNMNTHGELKSLFAESGFDEAGFWYLDDCRSFQRLGPLNTVELATCTALRALGLHYPENCLLGVYRRRGAP